MYIQYIYKHSPYKHPYTIQPLYKFPELIPRFCSLQNSSIHKKRRFNSFQILSAKNPDTEIMKKLQGPRT